MLKSTHKPAALSQVPPQLPEGWTEHKAPTGHSYYYHASTKQSTYTRPVIPQAPVIPPADPSQSFLQYQTSDNLVANGFNDPALVRPREDRSFSQRNNRHGSDRPRDSRPQPTDKPISRRSIPGCDPWVLVHTKLGRRFVYNTEKDQSFWRIPDKLKNGILELDQLRIKEKAEALQKSKEPIENGQQPGTAQRPSAVSGESHVDSGDSSEYEEVEVTDDEDEPHPAKRQRAAEPEDLPIEFNEDDIAFQLAAMGQEYGLDPGEYDDGNMEEWEAGVEGLELSEEDAVALFQDLLTDSGVNPFSPWEKIVEDGKLVDDTRYTALNSMKARKEAWDEWSTEQTRRLRETRAREEKKDPRIPYLAFLQKHANPKLYWPEFKRKYRKEAEMRDMTLSDRDREKLYRDHVKRLQLPQSTLKADLATLLEEQPTAHLNSSTLASHLPPSILADIRSISLESSMRDAFVEQHIATLPGPPEAEAGDDEAAIKAKNEKERRQRALADREKHVAEDKRRQRRNLELGKGRLREEEAEIAKAMNVGKKGLKDHLMTE